MREERFRRWAVPSHLVIAAAALLWAPAWVLAQAVAPPGTEAARPPTERTLQPVNAAQTRERNVTSRDCKREAAEIKQQYRIQQDSVITQYQQQLVGVSAEEHSRLKLERDNKIAGLKQQGDSAAKKILEICRASNAENLQGDRSGVPNRSP